MSCVVCVGHDTQNCPVCSESQAEICPQCQGSGYTPYMAFDRIKRVCVPVTELAYTILPDDEDEAERMRKRFCKVEIEICPRCRGLGEI